MHVAKVEVLADHVIAKYANTVLGKGQGVYHLRAWDPQKDVYGSAEPPDISRLTLELGEDVGRARVRAREHETAIDIKAARLSVGVGGTSGGRTGYIIFDEWYGYGPPHPVPIVDSKGNTLAIVRHRSLNQTE